MLRLAILRGLAKKRPNLRLTGFDLSDHPISSVSLRKINFVMKDGKLIGWPE